MGRRESLVGFETGKLDSGVKHSQEDKASDDTAADALETNDSSDNYGPRPPKSEDAARLRKIYEQAHEGRKRQRKANFQALLTSFGLVAYVAVSGFLFLRYATPRSKRPQQVGGGSDYGLHDGYPVRHDNWYIRDNPNPPVEASETSELLFRKRKVSPWGLWLLLGGDVTARAHRLGLMGGDLGKFLCSGRGGLFHRFSR